MTLETSEDGTGYHVVTVRENGDFGKAIESEPPAIRGVRDYGCGELTTAAFDEIRQHVDPDEHDAHEAIATVYYDYDDWSYRIEYHVPVTLWDRAKARLLGGESA